MREQWMEALSRQVEVLEGIARDAKLPAPERLHAIELIARFAEVGGAKHPPDHDD